MFAPFQLRLMADSSHVFIIRQEQIRSETSTRAPHLVITVILMCLCQIGTILACDEATVKTNPDFAQLGKPFVINCTCASNNKKPLVKWQVPSNVKEFVHYVSENYQINQTITTKSLIILVYKKPHSLLRVRCITRIENEPKSLAIKNYDINIYYEPILVSSYYHWQFGVGGNAHFNCQFDSRPKCQIYWYKNDQIIKPNNLTVYENQTVVKDLQTSVLTIDGIVYKDYAHYVCVCENHIGKIRKTFQIPHEYGKLHDSCLEDIDCLTSDSFCDENTKSCQCRPNYQQAVVKNSVGEIIHPIKHLEKCVKALRVRENCSTSDDCIDRFAVCNNKTRVCECSDNYIAIRNKTSTSMACFPIVKELLTNCILDQQCQVKGSKCIDSICLCDDFHKFYWENGTCIPRTFIYSSCSQDLCQRGGFTYSKCKNNSCQCMNGYYYNTLTHHCEGDDAYTIFLLLTFVAALVLLCFFICSTYTNRKN